MHRTVSCAIKLLLSLFFFSIWLSKGGGCARVPMFAKALTYQGGVALVDAVGPAEAGNIIDFLGSEVWFPDVLVRTRFVVNSPIFGSPPPRGFTWQVYVHLHQVLHKLSPCERMRIIVHELVHRWQWDRGDLSAASYASEALGQFINHDDTNRYEREAYAVQDAFMARCGTKGAA